MRTTDKAEALSHCILEKRQGLKLREEMHLGWGMGMGYSGYRKKVRKQCELAAVLPTQDIEPERPRLLVQGHLNSALGAGPSLSSTHDCSLLHPRALQVRSSSPCQSRHPGLGGTSMPASS